MTYVSFVHSHETFTKKDRVVRVPDFCNSVVDSFVTVSVDLHLVISVAFGGPSFINTLYYSKESFVEG